MKKDIYYGIGFLTLLLLLGCGGQNNTQGNGSKETHRDGMDTVRYHIEKYRETSPYFGGSSEEELDTARFTASFPVFEDAIHVLVKDAIFLDGEDNMTQAAEGFLTGYNEYAEDQMTGEFPIHAWFRDIQCTVLLNTGKFLTLQNSIDEYTGGAHGMHVVVLSNYDVQEKTKLRLTDIVRDTLKLKDIAEHLFREQEGLSDTASFGSNYFFNDDTFVLADNVGFTKEGLLFYYNIYEIKPYAEGATRLLIPYTLIENILTDRGALLAKNISTLN